jgi:hypothetical protein
MNDPEVMAQSYEGLISRVVWALVLHPFDLIATRMITESSPRYATFRSSIEAATKVSEHNIYYGSCTARMYSILEPCTIAWLTSLGLLLQQIEHRNLACMRYQC